MKTSGSALINKRKYCKQPVTVKRKFAKDVSVQRSSFILLNSTKWVNGTDLTFKFIEGAEAQKNVVRRAFQIWKQQGIGLSFKEVSKTQEAILRIGFNLNDGSWSYVGRENLSVPKNQRTMNFGWDLTKNSYGMTTAIHEIGHSIGFQHEHQSPFAGITWNKNAVYKEFSGPPNNWSKKDIDANIINKLPPNQMQGSAWDPKSIMEYEFGAGLVLKPEAYRNGIFPPGILSANDIKGVKTIYPPLKAKSIAKLSAGKSFVIKAKSGEQADFVFKATDNKKYTFQTQGELDTVMVVYEKGKKENFYMAGDDDSGLEKNAKIELPLVKGRKYLVNIRVMYAPFGEQGTLVVS